MPVCFVVDGDTIVSVVDDKPKRHAALQRLDNIRSQPAVSLLVDHYADDWAALWWVRVDGRATVVEGGADHERAIDQLAAKYAQYREPRPEGAVVLVADLAWHGWSAV